MSEIERAEHPQISTGIEVSLSYTETLIKSTHY